MPVHSRHKKIVVWRVPQVSTPFQAPIVQRSVDKIPWSHNVVLMPKIKHLPTRFWYLLKKF